MGRTVVASRDPDLTETDMRGEIKKTRKGKWIWMKRKAGKGEENSGDGGEERDRLGAGVVDLPDFGSASSRQKNDVKFIIGLERDGLGSTTDMNVVEPSKKVLETRQREILNEIRKRRKDKRKDAKKEEILRMFNGEFKKRCVLLILFALEGKRRCGENLPSAAELASFVYKGRKGCETSASEQESAREILKYIVLSFPIDKTSREELNPLLRGVLETELK